VHRKPRPLSPGAVTADWTGFLGPGGRGVTPETRLDRSWGPEGPPLVFELEAGSGYAPPAVLGERLVYFHRTGDEEVVECLHPETGARSWQFRSPTDYRDSYGFGDGPRASPVLDAERVYTYGARGMLHCLDLRTGELRWKRDLSGEFAVPQDFFGVASTPVLYGDLLIVHVGAPEGPCVIALDRRSGKEVWSVVDEWRAGYATPVLGRVHGRDRCFVFAGGKSRPPRGGLICLDPATGQVDFRFPWRSRTYESVNASSPVLIGDRVFVSASYDTGGALLDLAPDGSYSVAWTSDVLATHFHTAIHREGHLYGFDGRNEADAALVCQEVTTGEEKWRAVLEWEETYEWNGDTRPRPMGVYRGTLLAADGEFLCLGERGHLLWLHLDPSGPRELARAWLFAAFESWTPPVLSRGLLYLCQNTRDFRTGDPPRLLCYDLRRQD
jgi:outer membrane protein assembly factor BamB